MNSSSYPHVHVLATKVHHHAKCIHNSNALVMGSAVRGIMMYMYPAPTYIPALTVVFDQQSYSPQPM